MAEHEMATMRVRRKVSGNTRSRVSLERRTRADMTRVLVRIWRYFLVWRSLWVPRVDLILIM